MTAPSSSSSSIYSNLAHLDSSLEQSLISFIHEQTTSDFETIIRSAIQLLHQAPCTRHAVYEYITHMYRVFTTYYIKIVKINTQQSRQLTDESNLSTETKAILNTIDQIETQLNGLLAEFESSTHQQWPIELASFSLNLLGELVINEMGVNETIHENFDLWADQCRPTQMLLTLLKKCLLLSKKETVAQLIELALKSNSKFGPGYDWIICYLSGAIDVEFLFEQVLEFQFAEQQSLPSTGKPARINVLSFFATNFSPHVREVIVNKFLANKTQLDARISFLARIAAHSPSLLSLLANELLVQSNRNELRDKLTLCLLKPDNSTLVEEFLNAIRQLNTSVGAYDLITLTLDWLTSNIYSLNNDKSFATLKTTTSVFIDQLVASVYTIKSDQLSEDANTIPLLMAPDAIPFLKSLNSLNGLALNSLINQLVPLSDSDSETQDLIQRFITLLCISSQNENTSRLIMTELFFLDTKPDLSETFLIKLRQEVDPFHPGAFSNTITSMIKDFQNSRNKEKLVNFVVNSTRINEWDTQNQNMMTEDLSSILARRENFFGLINLLDASKSQASSGIVKLLNKILQLSEGSQDYTLLKVSIDDLLVSSDKLISYMFDLCGLINDENVSEIIESLNELIDLVKSILLHLSPLDEDNNPSRHIFMRTLIDKTLHPILILKTNKDITGPTEPEEDDPSQNLFMSNINLINSELVHNSRLKTLRNTLQQPLKKRTRPNANNEMKWIRNSAVIDMLETVCSQYDLFEEKIKQAGGQSRTLAEIAGGLKVRKELCGELMCNAADLLVESVLLEQYFVDFHWPSSSLPDVDENFDTELDCVKMLIERDVFVQKVFENELNDQILWLLLEFIINDDKGFYRVSPLIRSLLESVLLQWESYHDQPTRNVAKTLKTTLKILNLINKAKVLTRPFSLIVDIIPLVSSYEAHLLLLIIWRQLRRNVHQHFKFVSSYPTSSDNAAELKQLRYIFQKNIVKLAPFYSKFFN